MTPNTLKELLEHSHLVLALARQERWHELLQQLEQRGPLEAYIARFSADPEWPAAAQLLAQHQQELSTCAHVAKQAAEQESFSEQQFLKFLQAASHNSPTQREWKA